MAERLESVQRAFSAYLIERELGSGGMATVYLAHDKKHDRKVAIKILHAELAAVLGAERFLQEIRVTANLQHPHILGLIDSGVIGDDGGELRGRPYYVMPFVEGESLRQRLDKEQQLPVSDSVRIATEVASALDYAHRHNVIHRDIKPENILLHDGSAIVADFGIALAVTEAGGARITQTGLSLGTPGYMSPEQAMGERAITARSDIYSLGAVTYEMLSGEPPFTGPTVQAVVARVMTEEPRPLTTQRRNVPANVAAAVSRALEKIPADRFASAHEFAEALNNPLFTLSGASGTATDRDRTTRRLRQMLYGTAALAALFLAVALWGWMRPGPVKQVVRYGLMLDSAEGMAPAGASWSRLAISPDGLRLAYIGGPHAQLLVRARNQLHATAIPGTEGVQTPFFSPDGEYVGFIAGGKSLRIASLNGGEPITVTDSLVGRAGASWGRDGYIYADGSGSVSLVRVEAKAGGVPKWFTTLDTASGEFDHLWPDVLPNGKGVLFTTVSRSKLQAGAGVSFAIAAAEVPSGKHRVIVNNAVYARYVPTGRLLYVTTNRTLMVVPFDQNSMRVTGEPSAVIEGIRIGAGLSMDVAVSEVGTLIYAGGGARGKQELAWVTRDGKAQPVDPGWQGIFREPSLSPDGRRLAASLTPDASYDVTGITNDIWVKQLDRGPSIKLTLDGKANHYPTWTPDGRSMTFTSNATGSFDLWTKRADGSSQAVMQVHDKRGLYSPRWSPDGKWLVFRTDRYQTGAGDILGIRPGIDTVAVPLVATKFSELAPAISPDGRWLAYTSNESGQFEIYVVPFPNTAAAKWAVSTGGGTEPLWSHSGKELFYRDGAGSLVAVEVRSTPTFSLGRSTALFPAAAYLSFVGTAEYAVGPDDRRFLMIRQASGSAPDELIVVDNWFEELKSKSRK
jgi:Tol biopolymer transport system component/tRNA A-37 threonylcarbamoyl transferase component Bud32